MNRLNALLSAGLLSCSPITPDAADVTLPVFIYSRCECSWDSEEAIAKNIFKISWNKKDLNPELVPIAWNESSNNTKLDHIPSQNGAYETAFGPLGLKPSTAHFEWKASPKLQKEYPGLANQSLFLTKFRTSVALYNKLASIHWARLKTLGDGDVLKAAYGWRYGPGLIAAVTDEQLVSEPYTLAYLKRATGLGMIVMAETL